MWNDDHHDGDPSGNDLRLKPRPRLELTRAFARIFTSKPKPVDVNSEAQEEGHYYGLSLWGLPFSDVDMEHLIARMSTFYLRRSKEDVAEAIERVMFQNDKVVSRSGVVINFSALLIAIMLFIANNPKILPDGWERWLFYGVSAVWLTSTVWLLYNLRHVLPAAFQIGKRQDLYATVRLYVRRMRAFNIAGLITGVSLLLMALLLIPFHAIARDLIFGP